MSNFEPLRWELQFDLSNDGKSISKASRLLGNLSKKLEKTNLVMTDFQKISSLTSSSVDKFASSLKSIGANTNSSPAKKLKEIEEPALKIGVTLAGVAFGIKKIYDGIESITQRAVDAFSDRQSTLRAYTLLLGDANMAEKEYFKAAAISQKTELTQEQTVGIQSRLITSGFRGANLDKALLNVADLVTMKPVHERELATNQLSDLYSKVRGNGYIQEGLINRTVSRFVNGRLLREELGSQMGVSTDKLPDLLRNKKVTADLFFNALQSASLRQLHTQKTGEFAVGASGTLSALLSNQEEAVTNLFRSIDPDALPGVDLYKQSIIELTNAMSYSTDVGKDLKFTLEEFASIGTGLRAAANDFISGFIETFAFGFRNVMGMLGGTADEQKQSMKQLGDTLKGVGKFVGFLVSGPIALFMWSLRSLGGWLSEAIRGLQNLSIAGMNFVGEFLNIFEDLFLKITGFFKGIGSYAEGLFHIGKGLTSLNMSEVRTGKEMMANANFEPEKAATVWKHLDYIAKPTTAEETLKKGGMTDGENLMPTDEHAMFGGGHGGGGKGGGGGGDGKGVLLKFDYSKGGPRAASMFNLKESISTLKNMMLSDSSLNYFIPRGIETSALSSLNRQVVNVGEINIHIDGASSSPSDIADEVYTKFSQQIGRLSRSPSLSVL